MKRGVEHRFFIEKKTCIGETKRSHSLNKRFDKPFPTPYHHLAGFSQARHVFADAYSSAEKKNSQGTNENTNTPFAVRERRKKIQPISESINIDIILGGKKYTPSTWAADAMLAACRLARADIALVRPARAARRRSVSTLRSCACIFLIYFGLDWSTRIHPNSNTSFLENKTAKQ